jgi:hypothetical protein
VGLVYDLRELPRVTTAQPGVAGVLHVSSSSRPRLPAEEGFSANTCPATLDLASPLGRARVLPHVAASDPASSFMRAFALPCVPRLRIPPPH